MQLPTRLTLVAVTFAALAVFSPQAAQSQVLTLDFANGNGTTSVDQYTGTAGSGWVGAWSSAVTSSSTFSGTVTNTNPLTSGGGNYLAATVVTTGTSAPQATVFRQYNGTTGVNISLDHTISFDFRADTALVAGTTQSYNLFASTNSVRSGLDNTDTWAFKVENGTWRVMSGNNAGGGAYINTGMTFTAGTTYEFTIAVDADTRTYVASIYNGTTTYTSGTLGFRSSSLVDGSYLYFGASGSGSGQTFNYAIDNLTVVPEPGTSVLCLGAVALVTFFRRRTNRSL